MGKTWNSWTKAVNTNGVDHVRFTRENVPRVIEHVLASPFYKIKEYAKDHSDPGLVYILSQALVGAAERQEFKTVDRLLDRIIGKSSLPNELLPEPANLQPNIVPYETFVETALYPPPYSKQVDMMHFGVFTQGARMILGARGYGKTDYVVILGVAYSLYLDYVRSLAEGTSPVQSFLLVTKSTERNAAILNEILKACLANGVPFEKESNSALRVKGLQGKDHSISAITIGSASIRGRHPKQIIMDDPVTEDDVSEATRNRVQRVYNELTKLTDNILIIGQPVHKFDLYETKRKLLQKLEVPHGSIPELDHDLKAQRLAGVSEESIQASYFLKVISENGNPLENVKFIKDFPAGDTAVAFLDPSFEGGDYTALTILKSYFDGVVVKGRVWKRAWFNCIDDLAKEVDNCNVARLCFETNSLGEQPVILLRGVLNCGVVGKKSTGNKHARIMALGPFAPKIHISETSDTIYKDQTVKYEYGSKYDDAPDSLASCMEWVGLIKGR